MAAIYAAAVVAFVAVTDLLSRWIGALELAGGALVWLAPLSLVLAFFEPLFSAVALCPLFGGVAALAVVAFLLRRPWTAGALLALAAVPGLVLLVPLLVFEAIKVEDGAVVGVGGVPPAATWRPAAADLADHGPSRARSEGPDPGHRDQQCSRRYRRCSPPET